MEGKKRYFQHMQKSYSLKELAENFNERKILCFKDVKQPVSFKKFRVLSLENEFNIKLFKSYHYDRYILLHGAKYILAMFREYFSLVDYKYSREELLDLNKKLSKASVNSRIFENLLESINEEITVTVVFSESELDDPQWFYRRIYDVYGVRVQQFLKKNSMENLNG